MIYRYIYKITCLYGSFKDHYYYGQHTTENLEDGYKGSGKKILDYYKKHPNDYTKEIICFCDSQEELNILETKYINSNINDDKCLNIVKGPHGNYFNDECRKKLKDRTVWNKGKKTPDEVKKKQSEAKSKYYEDHEGYWTGKKRSKESIKKTRLSNIGRHHTDNTKEKISKNNSKYWLGKQRSEETKEKCRLASLGKHRVYREDGSYFLSY